MSLRRVSLLAAAALAVAALFLPGGASACGCGEFRGVVVAHGSSLYGAHWRIKAILPRDAGPHSAMFGFSIDTGNESGYFTTMPLPIPRAFVLTASKGSDIDDFPEADISGITTGRAVRLQVEMADGQILESEPLRAPERFRNRFHWLRGLRFYDVFFPEDQEPVQITALDAQGKVLERLDWRRGA